MKFDRQMKITEEEFKFEKTRKEWLENRYKNKQIYYQLEEFNQEIEFFNSNNQLQEQIKTNFRKLFDKLVTELFSHKECDIDETPYPVIMKHFTEMARHINSGKNLSLKHLEYSFSSLDAKLMIKEPMDQNTKDLLYGAIAAVIGFVLAVSFVITLGMLSGGLGVYIIGPLLLAGLLGPAAGIAFVEETKISSNPSGFFNPQKLHETYRQKLQDKDKIMPEVESVYKSYGIVRAS